MSMTGRTAAFLIALMAAPPGLAPAAESGSPREGQRPNFIIFLTDDQGYHDVGVYGAESFDTPHMDRMAAEGLRLTSFYSQNVCGPSRAALLTGCYPMRLAEPGNRKHGHTIPHPRETTLAEVLADAGYATACIGKWHLAGGGQGEHGRGTGPFNEALMPNAQGFEEFFGTPLHNGFTIEPNPEKFVCELRRNGEVVERPAEIDQLTTRYTERATRFIRDHSGEPFFLYLSHNMPHVPLGVSDKFRGASERGLYGDVIEELDWSLGRVLQALKEQGIDRETFVVFTSDNGPWVERKLIDADGEKHFGSAEPLRGWKMRTYEGGPRVPAIVRWPGHVPAGETSDALTTTLDLMPTLANLAGAELPDRPIDGKDLTPLLTGETDRSPRDTFYYYSMTHLQAVRRGKWKLVLPRPGKPEWTSWYARMIEPVDGFELYDLSSDKAEQRNLAAERPGVVTRMQRVVEEARRELGDYDTVGAEQRFFDDGPQRPAAQKWAGKLTRAVPESFSYQPAIPHEPGVSRRDPSDVLRVGDTYHLWYTKVEKGPGVWGYPSGYSGRVYHATSPDGVDWTERGMALDHGADGAWDDHGVFTPNILRAGGKFFLYYTGVGRPFDASSETAIGVAVADSPDGPWRRVDGNPVLTPSDKPEAFDSMRVDDAALIVRDAKYWLYYKGRSRAHGKEGPRKTRMGVAIADAPTGPFDKHGANPLHKGHEVLVWPHGAGVASLATSAGPKRVLYAADGLHFEPVASLRNEPWAPGGYRSDRFANGHVGRGLRWGISHTQTAGDMRLRRFDAELRRP